MTITDKDTSDPLVASVTIGEETKDSGIDGVVQFTLAYGDYEATVECEGYTTATEELAFRSNHKNFTVELEAAAAQTGTVTVTCQNSEENPLAGTSVFLCSTDDVPGQSDENVVAYSNTNGNGECTLALWDTSTHQPTQVTDIPFGDYYLIATKALYETYNESFTIDGDETVTITLTRG